MAFRPFWPLKMDPSGASPAGALVSAGEIGERQAQRSVPSRLASRNLGRLDEQPLVSLTADSSPYTGEPLSQAVTGSLASGNWEQLHTRVRPWQSKYNVPEKQARSVEFPCHLCDPTGPRTENRKTQGQPRTPREVLRGERPKWLFVHFGQSKWTPAERFLFRTVRTLQFPVRRCTIPQLA